MTATIWLLFHPLMKQLFFAFYRIGKFWKKDAEIKQKFPNMEESGFLPIPEMPFFGRPKQLISNQNELDRQDARQKAIWRMDKEEKIIRHILRPHDSHRPWKHHLFHYLLKQFMDLSPHVCQRLFALTVSLSGGTDEGLRTHIIGLQTTWGRLWSAYRFTAPRNRWQHRYENKQEAPTWLASAMKGSSVSWKGNGVLCRELNYPAERKVADNKLFHCSAKQMAIHIIGRDGPRLMHRNQQRVSGSE